MSAPIDLSSVIRTVHFSYRASGDGFEGGHDTYGVAVDPLGALRLTPTVPSGDGASVRTGAPIRVETSAVGRASLPLNVAPGPLAVDRDGSLWTPRGGVIEHLENGESGVEQSWLFPWIPAGDGDLSVRVRVAGLDYAGETASGLHFVDAATGLGVRYGKAFWVDHVGQTTEVAARWEGDEVVLTVPAAVLDATVFPAVLDPTVGPELGLDQPMALAWTPATSAVAADGTSWLAVWADPGRGGVFGARATWTGSALAVTDPAGVQIAADASARTPSVAFDGNEYLVMWSGGNGASMWYRRVYSSNLTFITDATALPGAGASNQGGGVTYDSGSSTYLLTWQRDADVVAVRVVRPGGTGVADASPVVLGTGTAPRAAAALGGRFLVAWQAGAAGVQARRFTSTSTNPLQNNSLIAVSGSRGTAVDVVSNGTRWFVVFDDPARAEVRGRRIAQNGNFVDATDVALSLGAVAPYAPVVAWSGTEYVVAWIEAGTTRRVSFRRIGTTGGGAGTLTGLDAASVSVGTVDDDASGSARIGIASNGAANGTVVAGQQGMSVIAARVPAYPAAATPGQVISAPPSRAQSVPAVASNGTDYLVVWQDARSAVSSDVYGARVTAAGALLGSPFAVSSTTANQTAPAAAFDGTNYLVVWAEGAVRGARVSPAGVVLDGTALAIGGGNASGPRVAFAGGNYLVVWADDAGGNLDVNGARVSPAGVTLGTFPVASLASAEQAPDVAANPTGDGYYVVWQDARSGTSDVYGARVSAAGTVLDPAGVPISAAASAQTGPSVACGGGACLVAWTDARGGDADVWGARVSAAGLVLDAAGLPLGQASGSAQQNPSVAFDGRDFVVAFEDGRSGSVQLGGNRVSTAGAVLDGAGLALVTASVGSGARPRLASGAAGRALVAYARPDPALGIAAVQARLVTYRNGISVGKAGLGTGRVTSSPAGIDCGSGCASAVGSFDAPGAVTLTATADPSMRFSGWSGDCTGTGTCQLVADSARTVTATFDRIELTLTVAKSGTGTGTVNANPGPISCGATCTGTYLQDAVVVLTPMPSVGSTFTGWSGSGCGGTGTCAVTMDAAKSVTATFDLTTFPVSVTANAGGTVTFSTQGSTGSCGAACTTYLAGTTATLTPQPSSGYRFAGWSGDCGGTAACSLLVDGAKSATASFEVIPPLRHTLIVTKLGSGTVATGAVAPSGAAISCGVACSSASASYVEGTSVTLTATADPGWSFSGWSGACTNPTGPCTVTMSGDQTVGATFTFVPPPRYALQVTSAGDGLGTVSPSPAGTACGPGCAEFDSGTQVLLTAAPASPPAGGGSYAFGGWSGGGCSGTGTCLVTMDAPRSVTATFAFVPPTYRTLTVTNPGGGAVTSDSGAIACGTSCSDVYLDGTPVTLTASPAPGASFAGWSGACGGTGPCVLTMDAPRSVTATFTYPVTVARIGTGTGTVSSAPVGLSCGSTCSSPFPYGSVVSLTAAATAPAVFTAWSGGGCSGSAGCSVRVTGATTVSASFDIPPPQTYGLLVRRTGAGTVSSSPAGIDCGSTCSATYVANTPVDLVAAPAAGYVLGGWSGACSGTGACRVSMSADRTVDVRFDLAPPSSYPLAVLKTGSGAGTVVSSPDGISCGSACATSSAPGSVVTLTATASAGSVFAGWSGGGCSGLGACVVTMSAATSVTAAFAASSGDGPASYPVATAVGGPGSGTVTASGGPAIDCRYLPGVLYPPGCLVEVARTSPPQLVTLHAEPAAGSRFAGWTDNCGGTADCVLPVDRSQLARAVFMPALAQVAVAISGRGSIATDPAGALGCSASACLGAFPTAAPPPLTLTARPDAGWRFLGWSSQECSGTAACTVTPDRSRSLIATFVPTQHPLSVITVGGGGGRVWGGGLDCTSGVGTCSVSIQDTTPAQQVTLSAVADADSEFLGWSGGCGMAPSCTVSVGAPTAVMATFGPRLYGATVQTLGQGFGTVDGGGLSCTTGAAAGCTGGVPMGWATFEASPLPGSFFNGWGGVCPRTSEPACTVYLNGSSGTIQAVFEPNTHRLEVDVTGPGSVLGLPTPCSGAGAVCAADVDNTQAVNQAQVTLTAVPQAGARFWAWSGACSGTSPTCTVTMTGPQMVWANFLAP